MESYGIHWFRRDLRVVGNPALQWSWKEHQGRVLGFFCFDSKFLARPDFSHNRFAFFLETMRTLREELRAAGGDLLVLDVGPRDAFAQLFECLRQKNLPLPASVSFNRDYEPFARARDLDISTWLPKTYGVEIHTERDHLLIEPTELSKDGKGKDFYQVFTPFSKRWLQLYETSEVQQRIAGQKKALARVKNSSLGVADPDTFKLTWTSLLGTPSPLTDQFECYASENSSRITVTLPEAGTLAALSRLREFKKRSLSSYADQRDIPAVDGTSRMSMYFKNGSITSSQVIAELGLERERFGEKTGPAVFLKEIIWREFYYHILYHFPRVESEAFNEKYKSIEWENREDYFEAWKSGMTGYPIVDAGMRQLNQTGWMHNRVRMIVASFLTKDLHIDWRWGEKYFMEKLLDGDLAPNNGGWQWAASTGCDPQPYFRVFNPTLQSEKFDPTGSYIRTYVPELKNVSDKAIHEPHEHEISADYLAPIVDHHERKERALEMYGGEK